MRFIRPYHILLLLLVLVAGSCRNKKQLNKRVSLYRTDKIPYGNWYAFNELKYIFPNAEIVINKLSPDRYRGYTTRNAKNYEDATKYDDKKSVYLIMERSVVPDETEVTAILNLVGQGKHIFISAMRLGDKLLDTLKLETAYYSGAYNFYDSLTISIKHPVTHDSISYSYPGRAMDNFFSEMDSTITTVLGEDEYGRANFVKFTYESGGSIYLHLAPVAFTNYFLLHKNNKTYYDYALSYLPKDLEVVQYDNYFRYADTGSGSNNKSSFSRLSWIMNQPSLAWAFWLLLLLMLLIYLFESKRKQRAIPVITPLKNSSLDFVRTVGRLYYERRDNKNLSQKMAAHFYDHVRGKYNLRTSLTDAEFEKRLAWKSGQDPVMIHDLLYFINYVQDEPSVSDQTLLELNYRLENFYKADT